MSKELKDDTRSLLERDFSFDRRSYGGALYKRLFSPSERVPPVAPLLSALGLRHLGRELLDSPFWADLSRSSLGSFRDRHCISPRLYFRPSTSPRSASPRRGTSSQRFRRRESLGMVGFHMDIVARPGRGDLVCKTTAGIDPSRKWVSCEPSPRSNLGHAHVTADTLHTRKSLSLFGTLG
jgi:hypothetical protein